jgi:ABC-type uncharacterized transport system auxiliary subunit
MSRIAVLALVASCALTSKSVPVPMRYFAPPQGDLAVRVAMPPRTRLRIGRIEPSAALDYAIVRRLSAVEVVPYETLRWTELPTEYVRRAIVRAVFDARGFQQALAGDADTLDVEVTEFEEVQRGTGHFGRVGLTYTLHDRERVVVRGTADAEILAGSSAIEAVVTAIGTALDTASAQLADRIASAMAEST